MDDHLNTCSSRSDLLAAVGQMLSGSGIEFGAGASPFPIGKSCEIRYADRNSNDQLRERKYFGESPLVSPHIQADFETMDGIPFESADFIIASHVIEHTSNPLRALQSAYETLRPCGRLVLAKLGVPDKTVTFDKNRPLTTLEHLLADYTRPSRERDWEHYIEFFSKSFHSLIRCWPPCLCSNPAMTSTFTYGRTKASVN